MPPLPESVPQCKCAALEGNLPLSGIVFVWGSITTLVLTGLTDGMFLACFPSKILSE